MAKIQCKMCGGDLSLQDNCTVAECEYCGSVQTVPNVDNEKKLNLFSRANRLRANCEFDKAAGVYESIVADFPEEAEAYWGLVLCKFGIEYVDDPATGKKVPTCHRSSFDSVLDDTDLELALKNADLQAQKVYRQEARQIEELRKGIVAVSSNEQPYDIFICYKETGSNGQRTLDSVLAQDLYDTLTGKGYRVFFARITLEDKLGLAYEPYIFAALNSARVMLAVGTDYEHYQAVWVKNEWSRYLKLMSGDKNKYLIPCYKDIDAYDLPKEFAKLQAQDLGKVGAVQDLLRGIEKLMPQKQQAAVERVIVQQNASGPDANSLLRRGELFLGDGDWNNAHLYFDKVLDIQPECAEAYRGKLLANNHVHTVDELRTIQTPFGADHNYQKAVAFGSDAMRKALKEALAVVEQTAQENQRKKDQEQERLHQEAEERKRQEEARRAEELAQRLEHEEKQRIYRRFNRTLAIAIGAVNVILLILYWIFSGIGQFGSHSGRGLVSLGMMNFHSMVTVVFCILSLRWKAMEHPLAKPFNLAAIGSGGLFTAVLVVTMVINVIGAFGSFRYEFWKTLWGLICMICAYGVTIARVAVTAATAYLGKKPGDDLLLLGKDPEKFKEHKLIKKIENTKLIKSVKGFLDKK